MDKLDEHRLNYPEFDYYLNAFIGSARAVMWVMKSEFSKIHIWKLWYDSKVADEEEIVILGKIRDLRNTSVKQRPLKTSERIDLEIVEESVTDEIKEKFRELANKTVDFTLSVTDSNEVELSNKESRGDSDEIKFTVKLVKGYRVVEQHPKEDILLVCNQYYLLLEKMVNECLEKFGNMVDEHELGRTWHFTNGDILK